MSPFKFSISNNGTDNLVVWIEPWAHDFTLEAGENLVLISNDQESTIDLNRENNLLQIYLNSSSGFIVQQGGETLHCGHKRKPT
ncbi:hypothetical protein ACO0LF_17150 [Undibacterium sp. Di27W]|uniref:hypothetical protein n=1 Tax=Undibacterium sp. Di27W TaxID=3413036 RepID=UPI003BF3A862